MMAEGLLEYSEDPLSDTTPTYVDVTSYVVGNVSWQDGKSRDLDEPAAGSMSFRLRNRDRVWEPGYSAAAFNPKPLRRFRWSVDGVAQGVWYATSWNVTWPVGTTYSEVEVSCVDGFELLSLDLLDLLDPPTASSYEEVVMQDAPYAYYPLNEKAGSKVEPVTGPEGTFKNTPTLGQDSLTVGETRTSVMFGSTEGAVMPIQETTHFQDSNRVTLEAWVRPVASVTACTICQGPNDASGDPLFALFIVTVPSTKYQLSLFAGGAADAAVSTTVPANGTTVHVAGTFDGGNLRIYVNGTLEATTSTSKNVGAAAASPKLAIGNFIEGAGSDARLQHVAFYEYALSAERVLAHYQAGAQRGFSSQTAGARISAVATSDLWSETGIQTGSHTVRAVMEHGQSKLDEIRAAVKAEMPGSLFYFDGNGDPVYKAWNFQDGLAPVATFGPGAGEIKYQALEPVYDDEIFNEVTVSHESAPGEETQHTVEDATSQGEFFRRAHSETGLILTEHDDAIAVAAAILEKHKDPMQRFANITLNSASSFALAQILNRQIGDLIRIKGMSASGAPIDIVTTILGRSRTIDAHGHMACTWSCGRGFNAAAGRWQLGVSGFTELGTTTVLG